MWTNIDIYNHAWLSFNMPSVNDDIPEDADMFRVSLTLDPDDQNRLESRVIVSPDEAAVTINEDNDGRQSQGLN